MYLRKSHSDQNLLRFSEIGKRQPADGDQTALVVMDLDRPDLRPAADMVRTSRGGEGAAEGRPDVVGVEV